MSNRFTRDKHDDLFLDGERVGKLIGAPYNVLDTLNALTDEIEQKTGMLRECLRLAESSKEGFPENAADFLMGIEEVARAGLFETTKNHDS